MATPTPTPAVNPAPSAAPLDRDLLKFLQEQADENRRVLREDSNANRQTLLGTLKIVAYPFTALIALAGFMGWRSIDGMKQSIKDEAQQEIHTAMGQIQQKAAKETQLEITRMQTEIRQKLSAQFETPQLRQAVKEAAAGQTQAVIRPLIQREVETDVSRGVKDEQQTINSTLVSETQKAMSQIEPKINGIVADRVNSTVDQAMTKKIDSEIKPVLNSLQSNQQVSSLILRAQANDALAFDQMVQIATNPNSEAALRESTLRVVRYILEEHNQGIYMSREFFQKKTEAEMLQLLSAPDAGTRQAVLDSLSPGSVEQNMDRIFQVMTNDPDLKVREAGFRRFSQARNEPDRAKQIQNLDNYSAAQWWFANRADFLANHPAPPAPKAPPVPASNVPTHQ